MESRNFKLDTEWNIIHYPEKPNGFGILVIGDERHFVSQDSSFWLQNEGKRKLLNHWKDKGYTVFYSNLYGRNWGSEKAVELAIRLCNHIVRNEILNGSFHVVAEGMGALAAMELIGRSDIQIRSLLLFNPILTLGTHLEQEKENKFFYKKLISELENAYGMDMTSLHEQIKDEDRLTGLREEVPVKIIQVLSGNRAYKQSKILKELSDKWKKAGFPIRIRYVLPEKKFQAGCQSVQFFKEHEWIL